MSVNNVNGSQSIFDQINQQNQADSKSGAGSTEADNEMFMKLMIAQLQNQDPTNPADTTDFMQQIATMSTVENIVNLTNTVEQMSSSMLSSQAALQASSMVGQDVYTQTDTAKVGASNEIRGVVELPVSTESLRVTVYDAAGNQLDEVDMGPQAAGDRYYIWSAGDYGEGSYRVVAEAMVEGEYKAAVSYIAYNVNSVTLGQNGIGMEVNTDAGTIPFSQVKRIG